MPWSNNSGGGGWKGGGGGPWGQGPQQRGPQPPDLEELLRRSQDRLRNILPAGGRGNISIAVLDRRRAGRALGGEVRLHRAAGRARPGAGLRQAEGRSLRRRACISISGRSRRSRRCRPACSASSSAPTTPRRDRRRRQPDALRRPEHRRDQLLRALARRRSEEVPVQRRRAGGLPAARGRKRHARAGRPLDAPRRSAPSGAPRSRRACARSLQGTLDAYDAGIIRRRRPARARRSAGRGRRRLRGGAARAAGSRPLPARGRANTPTAGSATRAARRRRSPRRRIGYKQQVVAEAEGESQRFTSVLAEYEQAEDVTRKRLFLETMERVLQRLQQDHPRRVGGGQGVLPYLPLDQLQRQQRPRPARRAAQAAGTRRRQRRSRRPGGDPVRRLSAVLVGLAVAGLPRLFVDLRRQRARAGARAPLRRDHARDPRAGHLLQDPDRLRRHRADHRGPAAQLRHRGHPRPGARRPALSSSTPSSPSASSIRASSARTSRAASRSRARTCARGSMRRCGGSTASGASRRRCRSSAAR